ncbi:hypothetical protein HN873_024138, partial [Arachis hypogaea]
WHHSGRLTPERGTRLALNARKGQEARVKRQKWAPARRLMPEMAQNVILNAIWCRDDFSLTPQDLWTPQDPHLPYHSLSSSPIHQSPQHLFPKNPSPIKSHLSLHHSHPSLI